MELPTTLNHDLQMKMNNSLKQLTKFERKQQQRKRKHTHKTTKQAKTGHLPIHLPTWQSITSVTEQKSLTIWAKDYSLQIWT